MIARYELAAGAVDTISGEMLHRDGISHAGDQLVKRLLEKVIVPYFSDRVGMQPEERERLFGEELPLEPPFPGGANLVDQSPVRALGPGVSAKRGR